MNIELNVGRNNQKGIAGFRNKLFSSLMLDVGNDGFLSLCEISKEISIQINLNLRDRVDVILNNSTKNRKCYQINR